MTGVRLYAGTRKGLFVLEADADRSDWTVREPILAGWEVSNVCADERADRLFAAVGHFVYGPTIHRSDDGGDRWEQVEASPTYPADADRELNQIWTVEPGRRDDPRTLYAGVDEAGLFVSRDGGDSWAEVEGLSDHDTRAKWFPGKGGLCCHSVLVHPDDPDRLWVGISAVGVFRTDDGGETWSLTNDGLEVVAPDDDHDALGSCVHRLVLDPTDPDRLYQQNHRGVFRSTNAGDTWERIDDGLPSTFGFPILLHPHEPETLYVFPLESDEQRMAIDGEPAVYRSTDAGDTWERCADGLPTRSWITVLRHGLAADSLDPAGLYVGTTGGDVFYSADAGDSWDRIDAHLPRIYSLTATVVE
jgi:photosystem II stability/assembly factor-like uncharacterized protein